MYLFVSPYHPFVDLAHHVVSESQYITHIALRWGYFLPICLQTNEISTPFIHLSWFAGKALLHCNDCLRSFLARLQLAMELLFALLFGLSRVLFNTVLYLATCYTLYYFVFVADTVPKFALLLSFANFTMYLTVQYFWFSAIWRKFVEIVLKRGKTTSSSTSTNSSKAVKSD